MTNESRHPGEGAAAGNVYSGNDVTSPLSSEPQVIEEFLRLFEPYVHLCSFDNDGKSNGQYFGSDIEAAISFASRLNHDGFNVYLTANIPTDDCGTKPSKDQIAAVRVAHVDVDPPKTGDAFDKGAALATLLADRPSLVVDSGGGLQAYWFLNEAIEASPNNVAATEDLNRGFVARFDGDKASINVDRLLRVPGTVNWPNAKKKAAGRLPAVAKIAHIGSGAKPTLAQLQAYFGQAPSRSVEPAHDRPPARSVGDQDVVASLCREFALAALHGGDLTAYDGDASAGDQALVNAILPRTGFDREQAERIWLNSPLGQRAKTQSRKDYRNFTISKAFGGKRPELNAVADQWIRDQLGRKQSAAGKPQSSRFALLSGEDLRNLPRPTWRVKGVLPAQGLAVIYAPSTAGKSFFAFDLGCTIAEGREWFGHRTKSTSVIYLALEGKAGFPTRVAAWEHRNERRLPSNMHVVLDSFNLRDASDVAELAKVCPQSSVIFIDTLARAGDDDENDSKQRREIIERASQLQELIEGLVVLIAHTGKEEDKGIRGHKSLFDSLDASIVISRQDNLRSWRSDKVKEGVENDRTSFQLQSVQIGTDEDGDLITSCVIEPIVKASIDHEKPIVGETKRAYSSFQRAAGERGALNSDGGFAGLHERFWREQYYKDRDGSDAAKRKGFARSKDELLERAMVVETNGQFKLGGENAALSNQLIATQIAAHESGHVPDNGETCLVS